MSAMLDAELVERLREGYRREAANMRETAQAIAFGQSMVRADRMFADAVEAEYRASVLRPVCWEMLTPAEQAYLTILLRFWRSSGHRPDLTQMYPPANAGDPRVSHEKCTAAIDSHPAPLDSASRARVQLDRSGQPLDSGLA